MLSDLPQLLSGRAGTQPARPGRHHPCPAHPLPSKELDIKGLLVSAPSGSEGGLLLFLAFFVMSGPF